MNTELRVIIAYWGTQKPPFSTKGFDSHEAADDHGWLAIYGADVVQRILNTGRSKKIQLVHLQCDGFADAEMMARDIAGASKQ